MKLQLSRRYLSLQFAFIIFSLPLFAHARSSEPCHPFLLRSLSPPATWKSTASKESISQLLEKLSALKGYEQISTLYKEWLVSEGSSLSEAKQREVLNCVASYSLRDTNGNGIRDWTAVVDGKFSRTLLPYDDDIDGDGTPNELDPAPFDAKIKGNALTGEVPAHLRDSRPEVQALQQQLYRQFGVLAINYSDAHSPLVLRSLLALLKSAIPSTVEEKLKNFRYLYAFDGHDAENDIAAFHPDAKAISIGGVKAYTNRGPASLVDTGVEIGILSSLAHEIGHAFLLGFVSAKELGTVSSKFGGWRNVSTESVYSPSFFQRHPNFKGSGPLQWKGWNLTTAYAATNAHEWFADAFAGVMLRKLGKTGALGTEWESRLRVEPKNPHSFWTNYNNISLPFEAWMMDRMSRP